MSPEIGSVEEASTLFLNARVQMDRKYDRKIDCRIRLGTYSEDEPAIVVEMREREEGSLRPALIEFFSEVGVPSFVISGSNYDLISSILQKHNKKLQRKLKGALIGKHVVDSRL
jgi:hypothetical protein